MAPCVQHYYHISIFVHTQLMTKPISAHMRELNGSVWSISSWGLCWLNNEKVISLHWLHPQAFCKEYILLCSEETLSYILIIYLIHNICYASKIVSVWVWVFVEWVRDRKKESSCLKEVIGTFSHAAFLLASLQHEHHLYCSVLTQTSFQYQTKSPSM